ncbi:AAA ATPase OS=Glaciecola sp. (strain 4H-3-7+YE-5) GN=Glaag_1072 PE=4 SV=1: AAA_22 [Gemmataceae bacterium]|nr:AAA ATPase OS=Glaciecola sp. (strain 4H-3-7+YE-5) GN=Glaag_1072 PE=4 SV=1: AAA_22 [Gemmataceae bacterium]VTU02381.1 AAA ATPase OS=Glaciecola sp. (strain 4H-3-7+YE-5) GN=Glaag_1072 PE=4 SV=1: AAA_22 [Gemmataceae bacterium]
MDWSRFGLDRQPFRPAVDPDSYFPSPSHEAALAAVAGAFARRDAAVLLVGPTGCGKSLVSRKWLEHLLPDVPRVVVPSARAASPSELLQAVLFDLGKPYQGLAEQELRLAVTECLLTAATDSGYPTVLVLDEAQHLAPVALEELRLLANLETRRGGALFTVLVGHPSLRERLRDHGSEAVAQRIGARAAIELLTAAESVAYLNHQLRAAGGEPDAVFESDALTLIAGACHGVPRILNRAAALALELADGNEAGVVDVEAALESLDRLDLEPVDSDEPADAAEPVLLLHPGRVAETKQVEAGGGPGPMNRATHTRIA